MWHFLFGLDILFDNDQYMAVQMRPPALPSPHLNWLWNCGTPRPAFVQLLVKTQHQLCVGEWRPTVMATLYVGGETEQQLSSSESRKGHKTRQTSDVRRESGCTESQRDEHPLVKECAKRASAILFYSTLLFFFIPCSFSFFSSPLYLSIDKVHSFQKRNNGQVRSRNASSLRRRSLLAFDEQVTDWGTGRIYVLWNLVGVLWFWLIFQQKKSDGKGCTLLQWVTFLLPIS